jgi:AcrR family transcriptional regulator
MKPLAPSDFAALPARERLLRSAHDLFYRDGIRATGVDRVIAAAGVTKVTFYRHFPSKDDLIRAFLAYRHERWLNWFKAALQRHRLLQSPAQRAAAPLAPVMACAAEWFHDPVFRGCAFINSVAELGGGVPEALPVAAAHKQDMVQAIGELLDGPSGDTLARAAALALDGAIVRAQTGVAGTQEALSALSTLLDALHTLAKH